MPACSTAGSPGGSTTADTPTVRTGSTSSHGPTDSSATHLGVLLFRPGQRALWNLPYGRRRRLAPLVPARATAERFNFRTFRNHAMSRCGRADRTDDREDNHGSNRVARLRRTSVATEATSSPGSTGLARWISK